MEWVAVGVWGMLALVAMPVAAVSVLGKLWPLVQATAAGAGLALLVIYIVSDGTSWLAGVAIGAGVVGVLACTSGAASLTSAGTGTSTASVDVIEQGTAGALGLLLSLFVVTLPLTLLVLLGIGTSS